MYDTLGVGAAVCQMTRLDLFCGFYLEWQSEWR